MLGISSAEMCLMLFTMFAIAARHLQKSSKVGSFDSTGWSTGEEYADLSTRLLLNNVATNTLPGIQAQLLLAYYRSGMGSLFMSSLNMGMLVRKAFDLGELFAPLSCLTCWPFGDLLKVSLVFNRASSRHGSLAWCCKIGRGDEGNA